MRGTFFASCAFAGNAFTSRAPAAVLTKVRRSMTESPRRRLEVRPYYASGGFVRFGDHPVLADEHQSTTAMERNALRLQLAGQRPPACRLERPLADAQQSRG